MLDFSGFFPRGSQPPQPMQGQGYLIHGARSSGKTSFAFQAAVNCVLGGGSVVVLCSEANLYAKVPRPFVSLTTLGEDALSRMEFLYVDSWAAVLRELVVLSRQKASVPALILIDDDGLAMQATDGEGDALRMAAADGARGTAGDRAARAGTAAARADAYHNMALCFSYLCNMSEWLVQRNGLPFVFAVVSNNANCLTMRRGASGYGGSADPSGVFSGTSASYHRSTSHDVSSTSVGLPFAAFPLVRVHVGAGGSVQVTPIAADRADAVCKSFSLRWENGLQLA